MNQSTMQLVAWIVGASVFAVFVILNLRSTWDKTERDCAAMILKYRKGDEP